MSGILPGPGCTRQGSRLANSRGTFPVPLAAAQYTSSRPSSRDGGKDTARFVRQREISLARVARSRDLRSFVIGSKRVNSSHLIVPARLQSLLACLARRLLQAVHGIDCDCRGTDRRPEHVEHAHASHHPSHRHRPLRPLYRGLAAHTLGHRSRCDPRTRIRFQPQVSPRRPLEGPHAGLPGRIRAYDPEPDSCSRRRTTGRA